MVVIIPYTLMLLSSFILEMLYMEMLIQHWCMFLGEQNMCADFMAKEGSHARCSARWNCPPPGMESLILRDKLGT
jgi:hypothetical protein